MNSKKNLMFIYINYSMARTKVTVRSNESYIPDPRYCGKTPTVLWDRTKGEMKEIIHTYYGQNRPHNRSRGLALIKVKAMPKLRTRQSACDTLYWLSRPVRPASMATTLPVSAFAPRKLYARKHSVATRKCRAGNRPCGATCVSATKKCWVVYNPAQKRYLSRAEILRM
jgi:hypothetical protein